MEEDFLNKKLKIYNNSLYELERNVIRPSPIYFLDENNIQKLYYPDFFDFKEHKMYEVKSDFTWLTSIKKNILKLDKLIEMGFNVILVIDKIEYVYPCCLFVFNKPYKTISFNTSMYNEMEYPQENRLLY